MMSESKRLIDSKLIEVAQRNAAATSRALRQAAIEHARLGRAIPTTINGQIVWVPPEEILAKFGDVGQSPASQRNGT
jgi:hypothetical protein